MWAYVITSRFHYKIHKKYVSKISEIYSEVEKKLEESLTIEHPKINQKVYVYSIQVKKPFLQEESTFRVVIGKNASEKNYYKKHCCSFN